MIKDIYYRKYFEKTIKTYKTKKFDQIYLINFIKQCYLCLNKKLKYHIKI